ncbi:MAG: magnesium transporter [Calditrichia bacterium]
MKDIIIKDILDDFKAHLEEKNDFLLRNLMIDMHPADIAELLRYIDDEDKQYLFSLLSDEIASEVLTELDENTKEDILESIDTQAISKLVDELDTDDAADIISELEDDVAKEVLENIEDKHSEEIKELLSYPEDSAGGIMAKEFIAVHDKSTVQEAIEIIRKNRDLIEDVYNIYVVDDYGKFLGIVSIRDLVLADPNDQVHKIMDENYPAVHADMDQEQVAKLFKKYDLITLPVVNEKHLLVGHISIDDVVDVIEEEIEEDISYIAGTTEEALYEDSSFKITRARLPWLFASFFGEILSAIILSKFEATLNQIVASAFFIPIIMAMGGATGQQTGIIVVRGLVTGNFSMQNISKRILTEIRSTILTGLTFAIIIWLVVYLWMQDWIFGLILGVSILIVISFAGLIGSVIPVVFKKLNIDPALVTGPLIATTNDILGLLIYFSFLSVSYQMFMQ